MRIDNDTEIIFDVNGNCYIHYKDSVYDFTIDHKNNLVVEKVNDFDLKSEQKVELYNLKNIDGEKTLKNKIIAENELHNLLEQDMNVHNIYYYEDASLIEPELESESEEIIFSISDENKGKNTKIVVHDNEIPLYDTLLVSDNNVLMKTKIYNPPCRLVIDIKTGDIRFRTIGDSEKQYKIFNLLNN